MLDAQTNAGLDIVERRAGFIAEDAMRLTVGADLINAAPEWRLRAESELDRAEQAVTRAAKAIKAAKQRFSRLRVRRVA